MTGIAAPASNGLAQQHGARHNYLHLPKISQPKFPAHFDGKGES